MWVVLWGFIKPIVWKLILGLTVILTILAVIARLKHAGRMQERVEQQIKLNKVREKQSKAMAKAPRTTPQVIDALKKGKF